MGETCAADIAKGLTPQDSQTCGSCISAYTEGWKPEDCFTERNLGHCGTQYWTNQRGECQKYNSTCGEGYMGELSKTPETSAKSSFAVVELG